MARIGRTRRGYSGSSIVGILLGFACVTSTSEALADCRGASTNRLEVMELPFTHNVDVSRTWQELTARIKNWPVGMYTNPMARGLFASNLETSFGYRTRSYQLPNGSWCTEAAAIRIIYGNSNPSTVYVANYIPVGSCAYAAVVFHELKHAEQHRRMTTYGRSWLRGRFTGWSPAAVGATKEEATRNLVATMDMQINAGIAYVRRFYDANNLAIDNMEEYRRVQATCPEWYHDRVIASR